MTAIFKEMDVNRTGRVEWQQFVEYIKNEQTGHYLRSYGITTYDAELLFQLLDELGEAPDGIMDMADFVIGMQRLSGNAKGTDLALLIHESRKRSKKLEKSIE